MVAAALGTLNGLNLRVPAAGDTAYDLCMEFRILGPLQVEHGGRELPLGGPAERHLFAVLLCLANEPVSMGRLIDELWGDDPPSSAKNIVQQYISRLRRALEDETRLTTQPGGYVLRVDKDELDWDRFRALVHRAQATDNHGHSAALLREAIAMWRGTALSGAGDGPAVTAERVHLEEARLAATEDRIDCELELGRHCEVTAELESLVAQHPQRERLLGQLMLALYRCDRQPEALHCFEEYRRQIGEETGLEPSAMLTALEAKILTEDPGVGKPTRAARTPSNLPQRLSSFVGRETEIDAVAHRLSGHRLVTLTGTGGIGKTSLGIRVATELADVFPDGIWWLDLAPLAEGTLIPGTAAGVIGASMSPRQDPLEAVAGCLRDQMVLMVLDNCEHLIDGAAEFAQSILLAAPDVSILATSREPLGVAGEALMRVPPLTLPDHGEFAASEAVRLFVDRARLLNPQFGLADANSEHIATICRQLDGIPLAIELAAARMSTMALDRIADGIGDRYELLTRGARTAPRRHQTLRAMVDWSHDLLTGEERAVFRRLAAFAGSFTVAGARHVCGFEPLKPEHVTSCLDQLVDASLIELPEPSSDRFRMLETIRSYAETHLDNSGEMTSTMRRLATFLNAHGPESEDGYPRADYQAWYQWRHNEQATFRAVLEWSREAHDADVCADTTIEFRGYLNASNLNVEAGSTVARALDELDGERSHRRRLLRWMQVGDLMMFGDYAAARDMAGSLFEEAAEAEDFGTMGVARGYEAMAAVRAGNMSSALPLFEESCELLVSSADPRATDVLGLYAFQLARSGSFSTARGVLERMRELAGQDPKADHRFVDYTANLYGAWIEQCAGNLAEAERMLANEDQYVIQFGASELFMYHLVRFLTAIAKGEPERALLALAEIDRCVDATGSPGLRRDVATMQAMYSIAVGDINTALAFLRRSMEMSIGYESLADTAEVVYIVADAAFSMTDYEAAALLYSAALAGYEQCGIVTMVWQRQQLEKRTGVMRAVLGDRFDRARNEGSTMSFERIVAYAAKYVGLELPTKS